MPRVMRSMIVTTAAALAAALLARPAHAEEGLVPPMPRQGYYLAIGLAGAVNRADDDKHHSTRTFTGGGASVRGGEMVNDWLGFGFRVDTALAENSGRMGQLAGYGADIQVAPIPALRNLAVHTGAGVGFWQTKTPKPYSERRGVGGAYYSFGVTYDLFLTRANKSGGVAVTPAASVKYLPGSNYNAVSVWTGIELSLWSGLDRKALELPPDEAFVTK